MSTVETASPKQVPKLGFMQVAVRGRVEGRRRHEKLCYTKIVCPAPDPYSRPQLVEIRSKAYFAELGDETTVVGALGGYAGKPFKVTDQTTGEIRTGQSIILTLDAIE